MLPSAGQKAALEQAEGEGLPLREQLRFTWVMASMQADRRKGNLASWGLGGLLPRRAILLAARGDNGPSSRCDFHETVVCWPFVCLFHLNLLKTTVWVMEELMRKAISVLLSISW